MFIAEANCNSICEGVVALRMALIGAVLPFNKNCEALKVPMDSLNCMCTLSGKMNCAARILGAVISGFGLPNQILSM